MKYISRLAFSFMAMFGIVAGQVGVLAQGGSGLQVSPTKSELTVEAGSTDTFNVQITNVTSAPVTAEPTVFDFVPKEDGSPQIVTDNKVDTSSVSLKSFLSGLETSTLAPGEKKSVDVTVSVPKGQAAGSYYGVIIFNAKTGSAESNSGNGSQVALSAGVGHIVLIQVPGDITDKMQLVSAVPGRKDKDNKVTTGSIFSAVPNQMAITVRNTGNSILRPFGNIAIEKGGKTVANVQINNADVKATVLPNSNRIFTEELKGLSGIGRFTATVNVSYGNGGDILTQKVTIWVIPVWLGASIGVGALAIAGLVFFMVRKFRR